jgi:phage FluMu protein Com
LSGNEMECCCGRLLFKLNSKGIEIKCPRCRHVMQISRQLLLAAYKNLEARDLGVQSPPTAAPNGRSDRQETQKTKTKNK